MMTSPTSAGATVARAIASRITIAARSDAERSFRAPPNEPIGVRQALRITASRSLGIQGLPPPVRRVKHLGQLVAVLQIAAQPLQHGDERVQRRPNLVAVCRNDVAP